MAVQPCAHSWPMEIRECDVKPGKTRASTAALGRPGIGNDVFCVAVIVSPFGSVA